MDKIYKILILIALFSHIVMAAASFALEDLSQSDTHGIDVDRSPSAVDLTGPAEAADDAETAVVPEVESASIEQPLVWRSDDAYFRLWGNLRNRVNYNHLRDDARLNPDNIFEVPEFINFSEARLRFDGTIRDNLGLFFHNRLQAEIDRNSQEWDSQTKHIVDQAYASYRFGEELLTFWAAGKQRIKWGTGNLWTPVDTINPQQHLNDLEPIEEGRVAYRADIAHRSIALAGVAVPKADSTSFSLDNFVFEGNTSLLAGKIGFFVWDSDLALYVSDEEQKALRLGASFATVVSDIQFFGEAIFWNGESEREYVVPLTDRQPAFDPVGNTSFVLPAQFGVETRNGFYYKALLGLQYTFTNDLNIIFQYYHRRDGYDKRDMQTYVASLQYAGGQYADDLAGTMQAKARNPLLPIPDYPSQESVLKQGANLFDFARLRRNYLNLSLYWPYRFGNRLAVGIDTIMDVDDLLDGNGGSYFVRPLMAYTGLQDWRFTLYSQLYLGSNETEFGILPYDWGAFFQIKYFF